MKVICISGSPRNGNTEWMLSVLGRELEKGGAAVETLLLRRMTVKTCYGCLACEKGGRERKGVCVIKDDMASVYPKLLAADAIILATPCYMGLLSGLLKNFLDRTCPVWPRLEGKKLAGLAVGEESIGQTMLNLKYYGKILNLAWAGGVTAFGKRFDEAAKQPALAKRLQKLAQNIINS